MVVEIKEFCFEKVVKIQDLIVDIELPQEQLDKLKQPIIDNLEMSEAPFLDFINGELENHECKIIIKE